MLDRLDPKGSDLSKDAQVIRIGQGVARPEGYKTAVVEGDDPFERAAAVDRFFSAARGKPSNDVVLYSGRAAPSGRCPPPPGRRAPATPPCRCSADSIPPPIVQGARASTSGRTSTCSARRA